MTSPLNFKIIAVDFDDTLCFSNYPDLGEPNLTMINKLKELQDSDEYKLILWTCRNQQPLQDAINFCKQYDLTFDAINENLPEVLEQYNNIDSRKITADYYLDDKNIAPLNILTQESIF